MKKVIFGIIAIVLISLAIYLPLVRWIIGIVMMLLVVLFVWYIAKDWENNNQRIRSKNEDTKRICEHFLKKIEEGTLDIFEARECLDILPYYTHSSCSEEVNSLIPKLWEYCKIKGYIDMNVDYETFATKGMVYFRLDKYESICRKEREKKFELWYDDLMGVHPTNQELGK